MKTKKNKKRSVENVASKKMLKEVELYYNSKLKAHGTTPRGVDWNGEESQFLRFEQLSKIIAGRKKFSIIDYGCGYGSFVHYLNKKYTEFSYSGYDLSKEMVVAGKSNFTNQKNVKFFHGKIPTQKSDYLIASGIFNVRLKASRKEWNSYMMSTLTSFNNVTNRGFAFNCLTSYSDKEKKRKDLFYADPCMFFDFCKKNFSRNVALLHDYDLYEFTILVRK